MIIKMNILTSMSILIIAMRRNATARDMPIITMMTEAAAVTTMKCSIITAWIK